MAKKHPGIHAEMFFKDVFHYSEACLCKPTSERRRRDFDLRPIYQATEITL